MRKPLLSVTAVLSGILAMATATSLHAAELKVIAGGSMTASMKRSRPRSRRRPATSCQPFRFHAQHHRAGQLGHAVRRGGRARRCLQGRRGKGPLCAGADHRHRPRRLWRIVRAGAPKPDISTPDAFKKALLAAPSIAFLPASAAGAYVTKVFDRLGIAEEMKAKTKVQAAPAAIAPAVAKGEAELGVFLTNVLIAPGVELAGPFPGDLQQELVFTSAIAADTKETDAAKALIDYLKTPAATDIIKAAGMTPG